MGRNRWLLSNKVVSSLWDSLSDHWGSVLGGGSVHVIASLCSNRSQSLTVGREVDSLVGYVPNWSASVGKAIVYSTSSVGGFEDIVSAEEVLAALWSVVNGSLELWVESLGQVNVRGASGGVDSGISSSSFGVFRLEILNEIVLEGVVLGVC